MVTANSRGSHQYCCAKRPAPLPKALNLPSVMHFLVENVAVTRFTIARVARSGMSLSPPLSEGQVDLALSRDCRVQGVQLLYAIAASPSGARRLLIGCTTRTAPSGTLGCGLHRGWPSCHTACSITLSSQSRAPYSQCCGVGPAATRSHPSIALCTSAPPSSRKLAAARCSLGRKSPGA